MKNLLQKYKKALLSGAVCLLLALALAAGSWAALSAPRRQPEAPKAKSYPGLNIDQIGLRYDQHSQTQDSAAGDGDGEDGQAPQEDTQQDPDTPPEEAPKPDQITVDEPDPGQQDPNDTPDDKTDDNGDGPVDPEQPADDQPQEPQIATDLRNRTITQEELENDMFSFKAMVVNGDEETYLRVRVNGKLVTASGDDYLTKLKLGRNDITLLMMRGNEVISRVDRVITYRAALADEEEPEKGENPPSIRTNLDSALIETTNRNMTLKVWANDGDGNALNQNHVTVKMDGKVVKQSTGSGAGGLEYDLFLDTGLGGDETEHDVTIQAWDDNGNSTYKHYKIVYKVRDEGEKIGTATVRLDLTVLGLGVIDAPVDCDIFQDQPASYVVKAALEYLGYDISFSGTLDDGFYLKRITRARSFKGVEIPEELKKLLILDGLVDEEKGIRNPSKGKDSVGEFDYTDGAGWMCTINGDFPGRGLSGCFLSDGDVLTLRFTLAYGKDIGDESGRGNLTKYCGTWIDGVYRAHHTYRDGKCSICGAVDPNHEHVETETVTKAATCTEPGEITYTCSLCGESHTEVIPAAGHHYENGVCTVCGQPDPAAIPDPVPDPEPDPDPEPEPTPDPDPAPGGEET